MTKQPSALYKIRFGDCDLFGHLNNTRYIDYFINAREDHLKQSYDVELMTYFKQGVGWVVGGHQISYLRPAAYNEVVKISSLVLQASSDSLLVEMMMTDENETHLKALLWTNFISINIKSGKREKHGDEFMAFAKSLEVADIDYKNGFEQRIKSMTFKTTE
jgi:YbgC/YbaW family acyl-CoA thioester hydrolase